MPARICRAGLGYVSSQLSHSPRAARIAPRSPKVCSNKAPAAA